MEVTSNIWGTKFKIHGLVNSVPANLGQVTYKTSLLHLQPRQMTLVITELRDDFPVGPDPNFNPNLFSEDEEEINNQEERSRFRIGVDSCPPIAPMSPRCNRLQKAKTNHFAARNLPVLTRPQALTNDEEFPYVELTEVVNYCDTIRPKASTSSQSTSFVGQMNGNGQRRAVSPLCCESSVPALQSPKNAVAPSDIIFDRPPAQTLISYPAEYGNSNVQQLKTMVNDPPKAIVVKKEGERKKESDLPGPSTSSAPPICIADSMVRSCSVGYLDLVDAQLVPCDVALMMLRKEAPKRLVLVNNKAKQKRQSRARHFKKGGQKLKNCGKSKSLDSSDIFPQSEESFKNKQYEAIPEVAAKGKKEVESSKPGVLMSPAKRKKQETIESVTATAKISSRNKKNLNLNQKTTNSKPSISLPAHALATLENLITKLKEDDRSTPPSSPRLPRSSPSSPAPSKKGKRPQSASPVRKHLLSSPLLGRKSRKNKCIESSDDEVAASGGEEVVNSGNYRDLETFQKAQLRQKVLNCGWSFKIFQNNLLIVEEGTHRAQRQQL